MRSPVKWLGLALAIVALAGTVVWVSDNLGPPFELSGSGCLVLAYHRIVPRPGLLDRLENFPFVLSPNLDDYTLYRDVFQKQIVAMKARGAHFITADSLNDIVRKRATPPDNCVVITLDDGDISQYRYAFPILEQEQIPFTLFVISGQIGAKNFNGLKMLTWTQLQSIMASGLATVGSHTQNLHFADRSGQLPFLKPENIGMFRDDLLSSIGTIRQRTGTTPKYFAYPYGFGTPETDKVALGIGGMKLLFTLKPGIVKPGDPAFYVKRVLATPRNWELIDQWFADPPAAAGG